MMERTFGGFIGLEAWPPGQKHALERPLQYSTGRAVLAAILRHEHPRLLHLPGHICGCVPDSVNALGVAVSRYAVDDQLMPCQVPRPRADEMVLFVDYFGIRTREVHAVAADLGRKAIVDGSMSFYNVPPMENWWFNSARKFFGLPDGANSSGPDPLPTPTIANPNVRVDHLLLAHLPDANAKLSAFRRNDAALGHEPHAASTLSHLLFERLDQEAARTARNRNFARLHKRLAADNRLHIDTDSVNGPLYYPLHLGRPVDLRAWHAAGIFAPRLWPDVPPGDRHLTDSTIPLPIDQRYDEKDMEELAWRARKLL